MDNIRNEEINILMDLEFTDLYFYTKELYKQHSTDQIILFDDSTEYAVSAEMNEYENGTETTYILHLLITNILGEYQEATRFIFIPEEDKCEVHLMNNIGTDDCAIVTIENFSADYFYCNCSQDWDADDIASKFMSRKILGAALLNWKKKKIDEKKSKKIPAVIARISEYDFKD
jgi:hypothetical protein